MGIELDDVKLEFTENLYLKDHQVIDIVFEGVVANRFEGPDSSNLDLVGPPSSTKTELLRSLFGCSDVYTISSLTPQTLISGIKGPGGSLLLNLNRDGKKILVIKDLTTILETRSESRQEIFSQLREVADGYVSKTFGTGKRVEWSGKLGILAGVTGIIDEHHAHNQSLGERFLYCRISNDNPAAMAAKARRMAGKETKMRQILQEVTKQFLDQFKKPRIENVRISEDTDEKLNALSRFVARARTGISRDWRNQTIQYLPEAEGPARLIKQLWILGAGIATIQRKEELDEEVYGILKRIAMNSLPRHRNRILQTMWEASIMSAEWEATRAMGRLIGTPTETVKRYLEDLWVLGLLNRRIEGEEDEDDTWKTKKTPYSWQLSGDCIDLIERSEIYSFVSEIHKERDKEKNNKGLEDFKNEDF